MNKTHCLLGAIALSLLSMTFVQEGGTPGQAPRIDMGELDPERRFDFLIGEWEYAFPHGEGRTRYESVLEGSAVRESLGPARIQEREFFASSLFIHGEDGWHHNWIDTMGNVIESRGEMVSHEASDLPSMATEFELGGTRFRHVWYDFRPDRFDTDLYTARGEDPWILARRMPYIRRE